MTHDPVDAPALVLVGIAAAGLVVRRSRPLAALAVTTAASSTYLLLGYPYGPVLLCFLAAVYTVARHLPLLPAAIASAAALVVLLAHLVFGDRSTGVWGVVPGSAWVVVPFAIGVSVRAWRQSVEAQRAEQLRERVSDERLRVAQEVHDVVGHGLAAIKMQADIALHLLGRRPEQAQAALETISRTSGEALEELRATLTEVRESASAAPREPTAGLGSVAGLAARMAGSGLDVSVETSGPPRPVPPAVDVAGYRVVQEALTNVLRHAGAGAALVRIDYEPGAVRLTVSNPPGGSTPVGAGAGLGIPGMRDRVEALGGSLRAGPTAQGGFEVHAVLPTEEVP